MKYYKLTDQAHKTRNTQWGENVTHKAQGKGKELCSADVIHVYDHPLKAIMFNPIHADIINPVLWGCRVRKVVANDKLKVGVKECTTIKIIPLPDIPLKAKIRFSIYCALRVCNNSLFVTWANDWLSNKDRTAEAARAAAEAARAEWAARAAAEAARAAAEAARAVDIDFAKLIKKAIKDEEKLNAK